jgi:FkbM family methyltransferase
MLGKVKYFKYYSKLLLNNWIQEKDTYAQHGEDKIIDLLIPKGVKSFIDIGANDGVLFSNTYKFARRGAFGICIEPSKSSFIKLYLNHLFHKQVICINRAISSTSGFLEFDELGYENVLSKVVEEKKQSTIRKKCNTLDEIFKDHSNFKCPDLISIDVEGHEKEVLQGGINCLHQSKIIIIEVDKLNMDSICHLPALENHTPKFSNSLNTIFLNKNINFPKIKELVPGFFKI